VGEGWGEGFCFLTSAPPLPETSLLFVSDLSHKGRGEECASLSDSNIRQHCVIPSLSVMAGLDPAIHVFVSAKEVRRGSRAKASGSDAVLRTAMPGDDSVAA
jgi:hypothetical protein